jgi:uncharacterized protein
VTIDTVIRRRRAEREARLTSARDYLERLKATLDVEAAVVFGSVARGDFNLWSDVDLLIIAGELPEAWLARCEALGQRPPGIQPIAWTSEEWRQQRVRRNPIVVEASEAGVWLVGSAERLGGD